MPNRAKEGTDAIEQVLGWGMLVLGAVFGGGITWAITEHPILTLLAAVGGMGGAGYLLREGDED